MPTPQQESERLKEEKKQKQKLEQQRKRHLDIQKTNPQYHMQQALLKYRKQQAKLQGTKQARQQIFQQQVQQHPVTMPLRQMSFQEQQAQRRQRFANMNVSRAEQLEIQMVSFNEIPMLHDMERQRTRLTSPPDRWMTSQIKDAERICTPNNFDLNMRDLFDARSLPD